MTLTPTEFVCADVSEPLTALPAFKVAPCAWGGDSPARTDGGDGDGQGGRFWPRSAPPLRTTDVFKRAAGDFFASWRVKNAIFFYFQGGKLRSSSCNRPATPKLMPRQLLLLMASPAAPAASAAAAGGSTALPLCHGQIQRAVAAHQAARKGGDMLAAICAVLLLRWQGRQMCAQRAFKNTWLLDVAIQPACWLPW